MDPILRHHGIKGQKWGIRRSDAQLGHKGPKPKTVKDMSDDELKQRLNRLNMEQQYRNLSPSKYEKGKRAMSESVKTIGAVATVTGSVITIAANYKTIAGWFK